MDADGTVQRAVEAVRNYLESAEFSGVVRVSRAGEVLFEHASGLANRADGVPNRADTRFGTASLTKSFTSTAVCRLVDQGALSFDARVVDILPAPRRPSTLSEDVTVHHLLTHTSGIADYYDEDSLGPAAFEYIWRDHPSYLFKEPADFLPLFVDLPPLGPPGGSQGSYCNAGYILLGLVIEQLSGRSYAEYVGREVFLAAEMDSSGFLAMDEIHERVALGYIQNDDGDWKTNHYAIPIVGGPDGGAFTTVGDLDIFLNALDAGVFFGRSTWDTMRTGHVKFDTVSYGYGLWVDESVLGPAFGGAGADPGFSARAFRYPDVDLNVLMLGNSIFETDGPVGVFRAALDD